MDCDVYVQLTRGIKRASEQLPDGLWDILHNSTEDDKLTALDWPSLQYKPDTDMPDLKIIIIP